MKVFTLELCVETEACLHFAHMEAAKLKSEVYRLRADLLLKVIVRLATNMSLKEITWDLGAATVPFKEPSAPDRQTLLITDQLVYDKNNAEIGGLAGPEKGWLSRPVLAKKGNDSVHIVLHEWLHTIYQHTKINPDDAPKYLFAERGSIWVNVKGEEWNWFVLSQLNGPLKKA